MAGAFVWLNNSSAKYDAGFSYKNNFQSCLVFNDPQISSSAKCKLSKHTTQTHSLHLPLKMSDFKSKFMEAYYVLKSELLNDPGFEFTDDSREWVDKVCISAFFNLSLCVFVDPLAALHLLSFYSSNLALIWPFSVAILVWILLIFCFIL